MRGRGLVRPGVPHRLVRHPQCVGERVLAGVDALRRGVRPQPGAVLSGGVHRQRRRVAQREALDRWRHVVRAAARAGRDRREILVERGEAHGRAVSVRVAAVGARHRRCVGGARAQHRHRPVGTRVRQLQSARRRLRGQPRDLLIGVQRRVHRVDGRQLGPREEREERLLHRRRAVRRRVVLDVLREKGLHLLGATGRRDRAVVAVRFVCVHVAGVEAAHRRAHRLRQCVLLDEGVAERGASAHLVVGGPARAISAAMALCGRCGHRLREDRRRGLLAAPRAAHLVDAAGAAARQGMRVVTRQREGLPGGHGGRGGRGQRRRRRHRLRPACVVGAGAAARRRRRLRV
ncbi:hypothetical protein STCU_10430 [Strigomonas culicis]|uniref:Uncharacterized protein n=1 Tax=Strigomonas culicis TaxID=28005 RepID=S9UT63_9TRYP|nr:hypothetical protein STCU_10430 [Strigomonas culicis]|eukprot:EPY17741.1 hypothetical protein STCU_10430 [Strigomonas culicis]